MKELKVFPSIEEGLQAVEALQKDPQALKSLEVTKNNGGSVVKAVYRAGEKDRTLEFGLQRQFREHHLSFLGNHFGLVHPEFSQVDGTHRIRVTLGRPRTKDTPPAPEVLPVRTELPETPDPLPVVPSENPSDTE